MTHATAGQAVSGSVLDDSRVLFLGLKMIEKKKKKKKMILLFPPDVSVLSGVC